MALDFALLFLTALGLWWLAGRLIDDVMDELERQWPSRARAHADISERRRA